MARRPSFNLTHRLENGVAVVVFGDRHYRSDATEAVSAALEAASAASNGVVIADLTNVLLLSSTAVRALRATHRKLEARGGRIMAAGGGDLVYAVLKFAPFIEHYDTVETALEASSGATPSANARKGTQ